MGEGYTSFNNSNDNELSMPARIPQPPPDAGRDVGEQAILLHAPHGGAHRHAGVQVCSRGWRAEGAGKSAVDATQLCSRLSKRTLQPRPSASHHHHTTAASPAAYPPAKPMMCWDGILNING